MLKTSRRVKGMHVTRHALVHCQIKLSTDCFLYQVRILIATLKTGCWTTIFAARSLPIPLLLVDSLQREPIIGVSLDKVFKSAASSYLLLPGQTLQFRVSHRIPGR
jgi:hypothetical protein